MNPAEGVANERRAWQAQLFPAGIPMLWCPLLTHFKPDGSVDEERVLAQLERVAPWVNGFVVPGLTGEGWDLSEAERLRVLGLVLDQATRLKLHVLVGVLRRSPGAMLASLVGTTEWLKTRTGETEVVRCLTRRRVGGFAVCVPSRSRLDEETLERELAGVLEVGLPCAFYQLPGETGNEVSPELLHRLAGRFPNLILVLDGSGEDRVAQAVPQPPGVFLVRAVEGNPVRALRLGGGVYDGLLLGSANCFPKELQHLLRDLQRHRFGDAELLSTRLCAVIDAVAVAADRCSIAGDRSVAAMKAIDHFMAHGARAAQVMPPLLRGGRLLPTEVLREAGEALRREGLMPPKGYLD